MSFGFSIGDFITVIDKAKKYHERFAAAPAEFRSLTQDFKSLIFVLEGVNRERQQYDDDAKQHLSALVEGCSKLLNEVGDMLESYSSLEATERPGKRAKLDPSVALSRFRLDPTQVQAIRSRILLKIQLLEVIRNSRNSQAILATQQTTTSIRDEQLRQWQEEILDWITPIDYSAQQEDYFSRRQKGTAVWLLETTQFQHWMSTKRQTLLCHGMPGAGKTIMTSVVIDKLTHHFHDRNVGVAFIFCNFRSRERQDAHALISSLVRQLVRSRSPFPESVKEMYKIHRGKKARGFSSTIELLHAMARLYSRLFVVVDALDECHSSSLKTLLHEILRLQSHQPTNIFVTSRPVPEIIQSLGFDLGVPLEIRATDDDLARYVDGRIPDMQEFVKRRPGLQDEIKSGVIRISRGMFLLAQLFLDSLSMKINVTALRKAINQSPSDSGTYSTIYDEAMERIKAQPQDRRELAIRVLGWITCAKKPLSAIELQHALAVAEDRKEIVEDDLTSFDTMVSVCAGLVTRDEESGIIRLVHQTTQEYFDERRSHLFADIDAEIATASILYLSSDTVLKFSRDPDWPGKRETYRIVCVPYYDYALIHWGAHAYDSAIIPDGIVEFLHNNTMLKKAFEVMNQMGPVQFETAAQLSAWFGLCRIFTTGAVPLHEADSIDNHEKTALWFAARQGHKDLVRLFLDSGTLEMGQHTLSGIDSSRKTCLHTLSVPLVRSTLRMAVEAGHVAVVETIVEFCAKKAIIFELEDNFSTSIIERAIKREQRAIVKILLQYNSDSAPASAMGGYSRSMMSPGGSGTCSPASILSEYTIRSGWTAAMECLFTSWHREEYDDWASTALSLLLRAHHSRGMIPLNPLDHPTQMKWLLASVPLASEIKSTEGKINRLSEGWNPMVGTIANGLTKTLEVLLKFGVGKEIRDNYGRTPLSRATITAKIEALRILLQHAADTESKDANGRTPLLLATMTEEESVIKMMLHHGAEIETRDSEGMTPVLIASRQGNDHVLQLLIAHGGDIEARDLNGRTALSWAASSGNELALQLLIRQGGKIEGVDRLGRTPLFWATEAGNRTTIEALIIHGANVEARDQHGFTPFWGHTQGAFSLQRIRPLFGDDKSGDDAENKERKNTALLFQAALYGSADEIRSLLKLTDLNPRATDIHGQRPLWYAMHSGLGLENRQEIIELLLADVRLRSSCLDYQELLMTAIRAKCTSYVQRILSRGNVDVNKEFKGMTPLCFTADLGYIAIFRSLIDRGAIWGHAKSGNVEVLSKSLWRFRDESLVWHYSPGQLL